MNDTTDTTPTGFFGAKEVKFKIISPVINIAPLKYMRVNTESKITCLEGSNSLFKWKTDLVSSRALQHAADTGTIVILDIK